MTDDNIFKKLEKIQKELKAPKRQFSKFGNYKYRSCEDILEAIKPLLKDCVLTINDEIVQIGDRYYVKTTVTLQDKDGSIFTNGYARESFDKKGMDDSQITGAASSYARKYALNGLFCIDDTKDADTMDNRESAQKPSKGVKFEDKSKESIAPGVTMEDATPKSDTFGEDVPVDPKCARCKKDVSETEAKESIQKYNRMMCEDCNNDFNKHCSECDVEINEKVQSYSISNFKRPLCFSCQKKVNNNEV